MGKERAFCHGCQWGSTLQQLALCKEQHAHSRLSQSKTSVQKAGSTHGQTLPALQSLLTDVVHTVASHSQCTPVPSSP
jgi:hypothetical protein